MLRNLALVFVWEDARVWDHWNHPVNMYLSHLGPVSWAFSSWVSSGRTPEVGGGRSRWPLDAGHPVSILASLRAHRQDICNVKAYGCNICVCWKDRATFFFLHWQYQAEGLPRWLSGKESPASAEDAGSIPGSGRSLEKEMAAHFSICAWESPWTGKLGGLQSTGSQRVRQDSVSEHEHRDQTANTCWFVGKASPIQWTRVSANSRRQPSAGKPGVLQSMGLQRTGHDLSTPQQLSTVLRAGETVMSKTQKNPCPFGPWSIKSPCPHYTHGLLQERNTN